VLPAGKKFDAAKALSAMTQQRATALVATGDQVRAMAAVLAADAALPEGKREYSLASLRAGLVAVEGGAAGAGGPIALAGAKLKVVSGAGELA
jgi:hypothetical protein